MRYFAGFVCLLNTSLLCFSLTLAFNGSGIKVGAGPERLADHGTILIFFGMLAANAIVSFAATRTPTNEGEA